MKIYGLSVVYKNRQCVKVRILFKRSSGGRTYREIYSDSKSFDFAKYLVSRSTFYAVHHPISFITGKSCGTTILKYSFN